MLNDKSNEVSFSAAIRAFTLEELRELEANTIDTLLTYYDELEKDSLQTFEQNKFNHLILRDNQKLDTIRAEINYKLQTTFINSCNGIFENLLPTPVELRCGSCLRVSGHHKDCYLA